MQFDGMFCCTMRYGIYDALGRSTFQCIKLGVTYLSLFHVVKKMKKQFVGCLETSLLH